MRYNEAEPYSPLDLEDEMDILVLDLGDFLPTEEGSILLTLDLLSQE
jgi:hypothetical protein